MSKLEETVSEFVNILSSVSCPLIIRSDSWWIEEILFKPGKPRTDLLCWIISQVVSRLFPSSLHDLDSTNVSTLSSSNKKLPESEEGIFEYLCSAGICTSKDMGFVMGTISKEEQIKFWNLLIKPCQYLQRPNVNTNIAFGCSSMSNIVSMENFLDAFSMKPCLLPADVKSEIEQFAKEDKRQDSERNYSALGRNPLNDKLFVQNLSEQASKLKSASDKFVEVFKSELKVCLPKRETSIELLEVGDEINLITTRITNWKKGMDSLLDMNQSNLSEVNRKKTESLLQRSIKDQSFPPYKNISSAE